MSTRQKLSLSKLTQNNESIQKNELSQKINKKLSENNSIISGHTKGTIINIVGISCFFISFSVMYSHSLIGIILSVIGIILSIIYILFTFAVDGLFDRN